MSLVEDLGLDVHACTQPVNLPHDLSRTKQKFVPFEVGREQHGETNLICKLARGRHNASAEPNIASFLQERKDGNNKRDCFAAT